MKLGVDGLWRTPVYHFSRLVCHPGFSGLAGADGTAQDPLRWSAGALPKRRRLVLAVRNHTMMLGPASIWASDWVSVLPSAVTAEDGNAWLHSVGILVMWVAFSGTLHWSAAGAHLARWIFIGGLGLFGPCLSLVLCMVLRPPFKL